MTEATTTPIRIIAALEDDGKGKKKMSIYIDPELADLIQKYARLNGISQGEMIESAVKESFFSTPMSSGKWRLGKR
jgi:hypothetical protein